MSGAELPTLPWLARRDDRARLLAFLLLAVPVSLMLSPRALTIACGAGALVALTSGVAWRAALRRFTPVLALVLPVAVLTPFWSPPQAQPLFDGWATGPTREGALLAATIALRATALGLLAIGAFAVPLSRTLEGASRLRVPAALVHTALLTVRFVEQLEDDLARARRALGLRGFRPRADLATSRTYASLTGALVVRSVARTERLEAAMRLRGYTGVLILPERSSFGLRDALLVAAGAALGAGLLTLDRWT